MLTTKNPYSKTVAEVITIMQSRVNALTEALETAKDDPLFCWIVADATCFYTVKSNAAGQAEIETGNDNPTLFIQRAAFNIVANFNASNGHGKIDLIAMEASDFYATARRQYQLTIDQLRPLIE